MPFDLQDGRYFTNMDTHTGKNLAIIGAEIAEGLFEQADPIGRHGIGSESQNTGICIEGIATR